MPAPAGPAAQTPEGRTGCRWEDLPERFSSWKGIHSRYKTWRNCGVWDDIMSALPVDGPVTG